MKRVLVFLLLFSYQLLQACGGGYWADWMYYSLIDQTNISAKPYYPFLRTEDDLFYTASNEDYNRFSGNLQLWLELLEGWEMAQVERAVYHFKRYAWPSQLSTTEQKAKQYLALATEISEAFENRSSYYSWDYNSIRSQNRGFPEELIAQANELLNQETNPQLKARYYYQIIRGLHYKKDYEGAIQLFENKIKNQLEINEIYYYILDQVAGCCYSTGKTNLAAYLFTKVVNHSLDKKTSAFLSFNFCKRKGSDGSHLAQGKEDEKDLLLMKGLGSFANLDHLLLQFIELDPNDPRIELLFMRQLNAYESELWPAELGVNGDKLPNNQSRPGITALLETTEKQLANSSLQNHDFWQLCSSYLSFILEDFSAAKQKLLKVRTFEKQKEQLALVYEVFSWEKITEENEAFLLSKLSKSELESSFWNNYDNRGLVDLIRGHVAHLYYKNKEISKAFLIHNELSKIKNLNSLELIDALIHFATKASKSKWETIMYNQRFMSKASLDYLYHQKGVYFLYQMNPKEALSYLKKSTRYQPSMLIPDTIFSNNTTECFHCHSSEVMEDEVYQAKLFSFIGTTFTRKELANHLITLEQMAEGNEKWKAKLANYLLGNFYYNACNSGFYRGLLTNESNGGNYHYFKFEYEKERYAENIIRHGGGYNLSDIAYYNRAYYSLSNKAWEYYQKTIELSDDRELNARCLYLMAKCHLNEFYNGSTSSSHYEMHPSHYYTITLPEQESFDVLKSEYADTKFHEMIIEECSYYRYYIDHVYTTD